MTVTASELRQLVKQLKRVMDGISPTTPEEAQAGLMEMRKILLELDRHQHILGRSR